jgi:triosephosphate isomerase
VTTTRQLTVPFFEIGPKTYLTRQQTLDIAESADHASGETGVAVIMTVPVLDVESIKSAHPRLWVFAQHMDAVRPGRNTGAVLPEALRDVGADGVMLNHFERQLPPDLLRTSIERAREVGLSTLVSANTPNDATIVAKLHPHIILAEPPDLIGASWEGQRPWIGDFDRAIAVIDPIIRVMHAGGIGSPDDAYNVIRQGASGTGACTAIVSSARPGKAARDMIRAVSAGWNSRVSARGRQHTRH